MNIAAIKDLQTAWETMSPVLVIRDEQTYEQALDVLDRLLDSVGDDESHPLYGLLDTLGTLVHAFEEGMHKPPEAEPREVLDLLMQEHGLRQSDLPEIGSQGVVSEVLAGKRELNVRQIRALAKRFHVTPGVFI